MIRPATPEEMPVIRALFKEYESFLDFDLCFQSFQEELDSLPGKYSPPQGALLVAVLNDEIVGCVAMRPLSAEVCEMKRLYLRPEGRGLGLGRSLCEEIIKCGREGGYRQMKLDTVAKLKTAISLYRDLGFVDCEKYCENPQPDVVFMELGLEK